MENIRFIATPTGIFAFILILGAAFVNGMTDACNSISGIVSSGIWSLKKASVVCGIFNFFGILVFSSVGGRVTKGVFELGDFGEYSSEAICACLLGTILFSTVCYLFSLPSSESHALLACIGGATAVLSDGSFTLYVILTVILHMIFSCALALILSFLLIKLLEKRQTKCMKAEAFACIFSSSMHGAQDGQKFIAMIMLLYMDSANYTDLHVPISISACVGIIILAGTLCGGKRIVETLGDKIVRTNEKIATSSDISASVSVLICSLLGYSVSTGNIKACSSVGAGLGSNSDINTITVKRLIFVSLITFPICISFGYFFTKAK